MEQVTRDKLKHGLKQIIVSLLLVAMVAPVLMVPKQATAAGTVQTTAIWGYESFDAQVVSKDWPNVPEATILTIAQMAKSSGATHLAIAVPYDNPAEMQKWLRIGHSVGLKIIVRSHWNSWEGDHNAPATLTASDYLAKTNHFLVDNASYLQSGDAFIYCVEPENGKYWANKYGTQWSSSSAALAEYNQFIRDGVTQADAILANASFTKGAVNTRLVSTNGWMATSGLDQTTIDLLGVLTVDQYVEFDDNGNRITDNPDAMASKMSRDLDLFWQKWGKPIYIGEWGFPIDQEVSDDYQKAVVDRIYSVFASKSYIVGVNYWNFMGNTARLLNDNQGTPITLRPAADVIKGYFLRMAGNGTTPVPTPTPAQTSSVLIADFEQGLDGLDHGTLVPGYSSSQAISWTNPANGSDGAKKNISAIPFGGCTHLEFDVNINGNVLLPGDASAVYFDQGGWKYVSLAVNNYVQNGKVGWQHVKIPLSDFHLTSGNAASIGFRFWNYKSGSYDVDNVMFTNGSPTPVLTTNPMTIGTFETGMDGFSTGQIVAGYLSKGALSLVNPANGSIGSTKDLSGAKLGSYSSIAFDINLHGASLLDADASALYFEQGGWKWISLSKYVTKGFDGWKHLSIPLTDFAGFDRNSGVASLGFRFWNITKGTYDIDNVVLQ